MRDLCAIFEDMERGYEYPELEDDDISFDQALEIAEQCSDTGFDDE